jgi:hypothetical protein
MCVLVSLPDDQNAVSEHLVSHERHTLSNLHLRGRMSNMLWVQVDRIEAEIMDIVPGVRYVDLETDRGRFSAYTKHPFEDVEALHSEL